MIRAVVYTPRGANGEIVLERAVRGADDQVLEMEHVAENPRSVRSRPKTFRSPAAAAGEACDVAKRDVAAARRLGLSAILDRSGFTIRVEVRS